MACDLDMVNKALHDDSTVLWIESHGRPIPNIISPSACFQYKTLGAAHLT